MNNTRTDNLLSMNDTVKFMFIGLVQIAMYHYDNVYVKVAYDNFDNKRRYDDDDDDDDDDEDRTNPFAAARSDKSVMLPFAKLLMTLDTSMLTLVQAVLARWLLPGTVDGPACSVVCDAASSAGLAGHDLEPLPSAEPRVNRSPVDLSVLKLFERPTDAVDATDSSFCWSFGTDFRRGALSPDQLSSTSTIIFYRPLQSIRCTGCANKNNPLKKTSVLQQW